MLPLHHRGLCVLYESLYRFKIQLYVLVAVPGFRTIYRGHGGAVVTHSPPTFEVSSLNPGPYVRKLVVAC